MLRKRHVATIASLLMIAAAVLPLQAAAQHPGASRPEPGVECYPPPSPTPVASPTAPISSPSPSVSPSASPNGCPDPLPDQDDLGPRPYGLDGLEKMFGKRCSSRANDARTFFPNAWGRGEDGYAYYHSKLAAKVTYDVQKPLLGAGKHNAFDYGIWGYACRLKTSGTSWSVHSWGAAIDTNTLRNPYGQTYWNGKGATGKRFGRLIPDAYMVEDFYWGLNFNDPMHFQYVSGY